MEKDPSRKEDVGAARGRRGQRICDDQGNLTGGGENGHARGLSRVCKESPILAAILRRVETLFIPEWSGRPPKSVQSAGRDQNALWGLRVRIRQSERGNLENRQLK